MHLKPSFLLLLTAIPLQAAGIPDQIDFNRDVRPILSNSCYACHGPDSENNESDLRLDSRESALEEKGIIPGNSRASEVIKRILSSDPDE